MQLTAEKMSNNTNGLEELHLNHRDIKKGGHSQLGDDVEVNLANHIRDFIPQGCGKMFPVPLTPRVVRRIAFDLANHLKRRVTFNPEEKMAGWRWFHSFIARHNLASLNIKNVYLKSSEMKALEEKNYLRLSNIVMKDYGFTKPDWNLEFDSDDFATLGLEPETVEIEDFEIENSIDNNNITVIPENSSVTVVTYVNVEEDDFILGL